MTTNPQLSKTLIERLTATAGFTRDAKRWESLIGSLLHRLELDPKEKAEATAEYEELANDVATKLDIPRHDIDVYPQGSMRTQTTIDPRHPANFDIDIVVELTGPKYQNPDPEVMFQAFGKALRGNLAKTGEPEPRRRCWRLQYPGKAFYFDVTPAVSDMYKSTGAGLRVRDPDTHWSPSNPKEFADWFCRHADMRFPFQDAQMSALAVEARKSVAPIPDEPVGIDCILRRGVQLMKLHRDNFYHYATPAQKEVIPISVVIVTLATQAYENLLRTRAHSFTSPIEVLLAVVDEMPNYIDQRNGTFKVLNPELLTENFADRWNSDEGQRAREFRRWHGQLTQHLEALLTDEFSTTTEAKLLSVFGQQGVDAWRDSLGQAAPSNDIFKGLLTSGLTSNPASVTPIGRRTNTLA